MTSGTATPSRLISVLSAVLVFLVLGIPVLISPGVRALDFAAFYCAGEAVAHRADPYRATPLGDCERRVGPESFFQSGVVMPAPLPPYDLAAFSLVARTSFSNAQYCLDVASLVSFVAGVLIIGRLTRTGPLLVLFTLAPIALIVLFFGQPLLVMFAALAASGYFLHRGNDRAAAVYGITTMLEPHVGLAVCVSMFLWRPRTRLILLVCAAALALISIGFLSLNETMEYFTSVLPLHARSEAREPLQFSLTALLVSIGVPVKTALTLSSVQYGATSAIGIFTAGLAAKRLNKPEATVLIPPLFAVLGGTFIHNVDFVFAIPAALLLLKHTARRALVCMAIVALVPHIHAIGGLVTLVFAAMCAGFVFVSIGRPLMGVIVALTLTVVGMVSWTSGPGSRVVRIPPVVASAYAEESWARFVDAARRESPGESISRMVAWGGLIVLCSIAVGTTRRRTLVTKLAGNSLGTSSCIGALNRK